MATTGIIIVVAAVDATTGIMVVVEAEAVVATMVVVVGEVEVDLPVTSATRKVTRLICAPT